MSLAESNKAKFAKRVIEVLEFFDEEHPQATVMDIVRRFDRPQSSTSELLSSLVDLGLLHKDHCSRAYSPTPRAAMLGNAAQPRLVRDGRLVALVDRLSAQTGLGVGVFGMVGLNVQICSWRNGKRPLQTVSDGGLCGGQQDTLTASAIGWLLLSTVPKPRRDGMMRRLNSEAAPDRKFSFTEMAARVQQCREAEYVTGVAGFGSIADATVVLLPGLYEQQPLAIGFLYEPSQQIDAAVLLQSLTDTVSRYSEEPAPAATVVHPVFNAGWSAGAERNVG